MVKNLKKFFAFAIVCAISSTTAFALKEKQTNNAKVFVGIGYLVAKNGASPEAGAILGVAGVIQGGIDGAVYGAVFGGPVGFTVGLGVGL
ncbi:MAG: hypothetical protein NC349_06415 [Paenibacillus sp.]|nr:hypothetical protein [Paenibacillus sp.]